MSGLGGIIRSAVSIANTVTRDLQCDVTLAAWTGQDGLGAPTYAAAVTRKAIVDRTTRQVRLRSGEMVTIHARVTFLYPIAANGAAGRVEPVDTRDQIVLPDSYTGPIVTVDGFTDRVTSLPFFSDVGLG